MRKYEIDTEDPSTVDYNSIREFVAKATSSEKAIQRLNSEKVADSSQKHEIKKLADQVHTGVGIPKEKETYKTVFVPAGLPVQTTKADKAVEELTKSFNQLNLSIGALAQRTAGLPDRNYRGALQRLGIEGGASVGVNGVGTVDVSAYRGRAQGMCWYCYNTDPSMRPHRYRDACPLFQHHVAMGTVHLNAEGRMVL